MMPAPSAASRLTLRFLSPVAVAFAAWGLWLGDVFWISDVRLSPFKWSALPICLLFAGVSSYVVTERAPQRSRITFIGAGFCLTFGAFVIARSALLSLYGFSMGPMRTPDFGSLGLLLLTGLAVCGGLTTAANRWLAPLSGWTVWLLAAALILAPLLSIEMIGIFPALDQSGANAFNTDDIRALKMGYPVFWTALFVPFVLRLGRRRMSS